MFYTDTKELFKFKLLTMTSTVPYYVYRTYLNIFKFQCCGAGAGGAEIIWDLEPELNF